MRNYNVLENKKKVQYDTFIFRSRVQTKIHNYFKLSKEYFNTTGNCLNVRNFIKNNDIKQIYTVDDGLSNWNNFKHNYYKTLISNFSYNSIKKRNIILPNFMSFFFKRNFFTQHFSIFSKNRKDNILIDFEKNVSFLNDMIDKNYEVKNLYLGIWPNIKNRNNPNSKDQQLEFFLEYIIKNKINEKIHIKSHPKYSLKLNKNMSNFINLEDQKYKYPIEILINSFPNLKNIYTFPTSSINIINLIYPNSKVKTHLLYIDEDKTYYSHRKDLFIKSKNLNFIKLN